MPTSDFSGGAVNISASGALTGNGSNSTPLAVSVDGVTVTIVGNALVAPSGGGGTIGGNVGATDNRLVRSDGTGGATIQGSAISVTDAGAMSGVTTLVTTGLVTSVQGLVKLDSPLAATGLATTLLVANGNQSSYQLGILNTTYSTALASAIQAYQYDDGSAEIDTPSHLTFAGVGDFTVGGFTTVSLNANQRVTGTAGIGDYPVSTAPFADDRFLVGYNVTSRVGVFDATSGFYTRYTATDGAATNNGAIGLYSRVDYGYGGAASKGGAHAISGDLNVTGSGSASNEYALLNGLLNIKIGTGFTQSAGPVGRAWMDDRGVAGPIAVQPAGLNGYTLAFNNYYNGSPSLFPSVAMAIVTKKDAGPGLDATHQAASTYANDVGLSITGQSDVSGTPGIGWTTAIQVGGTASPWDEAASKIGTGIKVRDYATAGIVVSNAASAAVPSMTFDTFIAGVEQSAAPAAPAANGFRIYAIDTGGKTDLYVRFASGAAQRLAIEP